MGARVAHLQVVGQDASMTSHDDVTSHLQDYTNWLRSWGAADSTVKVRTSVLARALAETDGTTQGLGRWLAGYPSPWTKAAYYSHLRSFYGWAHEAGVVEVDPTARMRRPRSPRSVPRPLSPAQVRAVLDVAQGRTLAYATLGFYAGLRAHEVAKIRGVDVSQDSIYVYGKGGQAAHIPTHPAIWALAADYPSRGYWFPSPSRPGQSVTPSAVSLAVGGLLRSLGIEGSHHRLRHAYGSSLLQAGANLRVVQELMRHSSVATTQAYTLVTDDERTEAVRRLAA